MKDEVVGFWVWVSPQFTSYSPLGTRDSRPDATPLLENEKVGPHGVSPASLRKCMHLSERTVMLISQLVAIAAKYNKEPANIALRWGLQSGTSVIPKVASFPSVS